MRAALAACVALALAGCAGAASDGNAGGTSAQTTGLVIELHFDHNNVHEVALSGATYATSRKFGPYVVDEADLPHDSTVGFVFDAGDAGTAMVCGEAHDSSGKVLASGCDTFDVVADDVQHGSLTLWDSR
jgi:hypothetical protein